MTDGCGCGDGSHTRRVRVAAQNGDDDNRDAETPTNEDLRRARQRARSVVRDVQDAIIRFLENNERRLPGRLEDPSERQRINDQITQLMQRRIFSDLLSWLDDRRRTVIGRAVRAAFRRMQTELDGGEPRGVERFNPRDRRMARRLRDIDAGLLEKVSDDTGDRVTRQIRQGFAEDENIKQIGKRVEWVMSKGNSDIPDADERLRSGVSGQTARTKFEQIAHDSIQDGFNTAARRRYLQNGFEFVVFDATIDNKTSAICTRMNEVVINIIEDPVLIPPLHPWCRSDIRPVLDPDKTVTTPDDISADFLNTARTTDSFRPTVVDGESEFRSTPLSGGVGET